MTHPIGECKGCGAPIIWTLTAKKRKRMPFDAEPDQDKGTYWLFPRDDDAPISEYANEGSLLADRPRFVPHWATCPAAKKFR
jgi:heat shock protein HspQ